MTHLLQDKVAIITGGSRGIGKAIALALAKAGATIVGVARSEASLQALHQEVDAIGGQIYPVAADLASPDSPEDIVERAISRYGRLDILINNAGIALNRRLQETPCEEWDQVMNINARAPFLLCKAALPYLKQSDRGAIIQIASVVGVKGYVDQGAYSASKHALMGMSKVLAQEVQSDNIRVHTILPGGVATDMISSVRPDLDPTALIQPTEIAEIVMFLLTRQGNAVIDSINVRRAASAPWF